MGEIKNNGIPTPKTKGSMGDIYIDTSTGEQYECVFAYSSHAYNKNEDYYAWVKLKNQSSVSAKEPYIEETYNADGDITHIKMVGQTVVRPYEFAYLVSLAEIDLPANITSIGMYAFVNNVYLRLTELPSGLTVIGPNAFNNCKDISITEIPSGVTSIAANAFIDCVGLTSIRFLGTPTSINATAFKNCTNLKEIKVPWSEGAVANAPWGATNATITYDYTE